MKDIKYKTFMFTQDIILPKSIVELPYKSDLTWIAASDRVKTSGVRVNREKVRTPYFGILATYLYIAQALKREDAATIAKLNNASSMFSLLREYGPTVLKLIET